jgi:protein TonB
MNETAFYQPKKGHPTALAVVVLMHGAAIAALALAKMDVIPKLKIPPTVVQLIKNPPPPPENQPVVEPQKQAAVVTRTLPIIEMPPRPDEVEWKPLPKPTLIIPDPGPMILPKVDPPAPPPPEAKKLEPARAKANLASYVSDEDYPAAAIRAEDQGTTRFRLSIGSDGRVTECTITSSSGSSALDSTTCRLMKQRARFTPARDSSGKAVGDTVGGGIRWVLPDG